MITQKRAIEILRGRFHCLENPFNLTYEEETYLRSIPGVPGKPGTFTVLYKLERMVSN